MGQNRVLGSPFQTSAISEGTKSTHKVDLYEVSAPMGAPVVMTLDPNAVTGDRVSIQDVVGNAGSQAITIAPSEGQTILGYDSAISIATDYGRVDLSYVGVLKTWIPTLGGALAASGFPRISAIGPSVSTGVPAPQTVTGTASVTNGSTSVAFSTSQTFAQNDLLFFNDGTNQPYQLAAAVSGTSGTLTRPYGGSTNHTISVTTIPAADFILDPGTLTGLPTTGWTVNVQGTLQWNNPSEIGSEVLKIYVEGVSPSVSPPDGYTVTVDLPEESGTQVVPFNVDFTYPSPSPTSFHATLMGLDVTVGASSGNISSGVNSIFMSVSRVA